MEQRPRIGPFELIACLGSGGMGEVWSAREVASGTPAAVKLLTASRARSPRFIAALEREVRALARLSHHHIVGVLDHGIVAPGVQCAVPGSPWVAMELVDGGSLYRRRLSWPATREVLLRVLAALAHAHARGVVHRDVKPANLLSVRDAPALAVKLADFGIAHCTDGEETVSLQAGTPAYMAPEQAAGLSLEIGPPTDLYAVGRTALALLTGSSTGRVRVHPAPDVPADLDDWLAGMLADDPAARFPLAADAAEALRRLGPPAHPLDWAERHAAVDGTTETLAPTEFESTQRAPEGPGPDLEELAIAACDEAPHAPVHPPAPGARSWRPTPAERGLPVRSLGLFGLRRPPVVGRSAEQDALWDALAEVAADGRARAIVVHGPEGAGASTLAEWLCERAEELGIATHLIARHEPGADGARALGDMLGRRLRCIGLDPTTARRRCSRLAIRWPTRDPLAGARVAQVVADPGEVRAADRDATVLSLLGWLGAERPVVVWLDDADRGAEAVELTRRALTAAASPPALFVLTARAPLDLEGPGASELALRPLEGSSRMALVRAALPLEPTLSGRVAEAMGATPGAAASLLRAWVASDVLEHGPAGLVLREGVGVERALAAASGLWPSVLAAVPPVERDALACVATAGRTVSADLWGAAAAHADADPGEALRPLLDAGGAVPHADGSWTFADEGLRRHLIAWAAEEGRSAQHHRFCADHLARTGGPHGALGRHLLDAGQPLEALPHLLEATSAAISRERWGDAAALAGEGKRAAAALDPGDERHGELLYLEARTALATTSGRVGASRAIDALEREATDHAWHRWLAHAWWLRARMCVFRGQMDDARALLGRAETWARASADPLMLARCAFDHGQIALQEGRHAEAVEPLRRAEDAYQRASFNAGTGVAATYLGYALVAIGATDEAERAADRAQATGRANHEIGARVQVALLRAEIARGRGDDRARERHLRAAVAMETPTGVHQLAARVNLALFLGARERYDEAAEQAEAVFEPLRRLGRRKVLAAAHASCLVVQAHREDPRAFDADLRAYAEIMGPAEEADVDLVEALERGQRAAEQRGWSALAARCATLAAAMRARLDPC